MAKRKKANSEFPYSSNDPIQFENIYIIVNFIQSYRKECTFMSLVADSIIIEHILTDASIKFTKVIVKKGIRYSLEPPPEKEMIDDRFDFIDEFPDEIIEDGQCF